MLCFNYTVLEGERETVDLCFGGRLPGVNGIDFIQSQFGDSLIFNLGYVYRAIYRNSLLTDTNLWFPENMPYGQDTTFMIQAISNAMSVGSISDALYRYRQTNTQISAHLRQGTGLCIYLSTIGTGEMILDWRSL